MIDLYKRALAKATGRADTDADVAGEPMMLAIAHAQRVTDMEAKIERLRAALKGIKDWSTSHIDACSRAENALEQRG